MRELYTALLTSDLLKVEALSLAAGRREAGQPARLTISFHVVNTGDQPIPHPFVATIEAGDDAGRVQIDGLAAGQKAYVNHMVTLRGEIHNMDVKVEVALGDGRRSVAATRFQNPTPEIGRWVSIGPRHIHTNAGIGGATGVLSAIAIHPVTPSTIYVGSLGSGVWKTTDTGASWQPLTDNLPSLAIAALAVDPVTPSRVYAATFAGIFVSVNDGTSWLQIAPAQGAEVRFGVLLINPAQPNIMYLATTTGILRSSDFGANWRSSKSGGRANDLVMDPANPGTLYASIAGLGIFKTTNGGPNGDSDWTLMTSDLPTSDIPQITLALCRVQPKVVYAGISRSAGFQLFRTTDAGASWSLRSAPSFDGLFNDVIGVDPSDSDTVYITGVDFFRSQDGGKNFHKKGGPHVDHHAFAADPITPGVIYALCDGGIYRSTNRGEDDPQSWSFIGTGIENVLLFDIAHARTQPDLVIGGTQDNGNIRFTGDPTWDEIGNFGDGATVDIDPTDANILYGMGQKLDSLQRSTDGGAHFHGISHGLPFDCVQVNSHFQVHPGIPSTLLASPAPSFGQGLPCGQLFRTTNPAPPGAWEPILTPPAPAVILRSAVDASVDLYYAGSNLGQLFAGPSGANFQVVFTHPFMAAITDIDVDIDDPRTVYVGFLGGSTARVFRLQRSSPVPASMSATDITFDLPSDRAVQAIAVDRLAEFTIYAGTDQGVFRGRSVDRGATWSWTPFNNGLPLANITDLEVHRGAGVIRACTFGRSAFEINPDFPIGSVLAIEGRITFLRVHDPGTGFGPPTDFIDGEVVVILDSRPDRAFGFQLRPDGNEALHESMLDELRDAFGRSARVHLEYVRTGLHNGRVIRVVETA